MSAAAISPAASRPPFQRFVDAHARPVLAFLRAMVGEHDAEDCFQETMIAALRGYDRMDGAHPRAWVMTIARRKAIDHHRARVRRPEPRGDLPEPVAEPSGEGSVISTVTSGPGSRRSPTPVARRSRCASPLTSPTARSRRHSNAARPPPAAASPTGCEQLRRTIDREEVHR